MTENEVLNFLDRAVDGQALRVTVTSGRVFDGIYDEGSSTPEDALYFETMDGTVLRAEWPNIASIDYRSARMTGASIMVPPEHPLSGVQQTRVRDDGTPLKPFTTRNR